MRRTYLYKAKINRHTEANCNQWLDICRRLYNLALEQRVSVYRQHKRSISCYEQMSQLPELKEYLPEFGLVGSQVLQEVLQRLDRAFQGFFQRLKEKKSRAGFPRFKSKNRYRSFTLKQAGWRLDGRFLYVRGLGRFKLYLSRPIEGDVKTVTIRRIFSGPWLAGFCCDNIPVKEYPQVVDDIGIDVGIRHFLVDSEGKRVENPKYLSKSQRLLKTRQRALSRKKRGSNRREKARLQVAKAYEKVFDQRRDFLHKLANYYVRRFNKIYVEALNIKGMVENRHRKGEVGNRHLSRSIADASWGMFFELLLYKAAEAGREVVKVPPNNTTQVCSSVGEKVPKRLSERIHKCPFCNIVLDRDLNASINILRVGQTLQAQNPPYTIRYRARNSKFTLHRYGAGFA